MEKHITDITMTSKQANWYITTVQYKSIFPHYSKQDLLITMPPIPVITPVKVLALLGLLGGDWCLSRRTNSGYSSSSGFPPDVGNITWGRNNKVVTLGHNTRGRGRGGITKVTVTVINVILFVISPTLNG